MLLRDLVLVFAGTGFGVVLRDLGAPLLAGLRRRPVLPPPPEPPVNLFQGMVFPDPADPRWFEDVVDPYGARRFRFGDSEIYATCYRLTARGVVVETGGTVERYFDAIDAAIKAADIQRALAGVDSQVKSAGPGKRRAVGGAADQALAALPSGGTDLPRVETREVSTQQQQAVALLTEQARNLGYRVGWDAAMDEARIAAAGLVRDALAANRPDLAREAQRLWNILYGP